MGRLVIPKEVRKLLALDTNSPVQMYVEGNRICIEKYENSCFICGKTEDIFMVKDKKICLECAKIIKDMK